MQKLLTSMVALLALVPSAALAQRGGAMSDMNRDQFMKMAADRFAEMDQNGDGALSVAEAGAARPGMRIDGFDTNKDGVITKEEFDAGMAARFTELDANHDGVMTADEQRAARGRMGAGGGPGH